MDRLIFGILRYPKNNLNKFVADCVGWRNTVSSENSKRTGGKW